MTPGAHVHTPDGPGRVIKDQRVDYGPLNTGPTPVVWVLLDCGENPLPYPPTQLLR